MSAKWTVNSEYICQNVVQMIEISLNSFGKLIHLTQFDKTSDACQSMKLAIVWGRGGWIGTASDL